ncbi:MAG: hypothetical protein EBU84_12260 [Actinobacteria bacterium]|nr:hypothetical protein [Actinomycetota bacterium]
MVIGWLAPKEDAEKTSSNSESSTSSKVVTAPTTKKVVLPWYPERFNEYEDDAEIAWRRLGSGQYCCAYSDHCWGMVVIARNGCSSSLYSEISVLDSGGTNIGFTNDTTSDMGSGQKANLVFEDFMPGAKSARLEKNRLLFDTCTRSQYFYIFLLAIRYVLQS